MSQKGKRYLVISREFDGQVYCYFEDPVHHAKMELLRLEQGYDRLSLSKLDDECNISYYPKLTYFVYEP